MQAEPRFEIESPSTFPMAFSKTTVRVGLQWHALPFVHEYISMICVYIRRFLVDARHTITRVVYRDIFNTVTDSHPIFAVTYGTAHRAVCNGKF